MSPRSLTIFTSLLLLGTLDVSVLQAAPPAPPEGYAWVRNDALSDEFDGRELDAAKWFDHHPHGIGRPPSGVPTGRSKRTVDPPVRNWMGRKPSAREND